MLPELRIIVCLIIALCSVTTAGSRVLKYALVKENGAYKAIDANGRDLADSLYLLVRDDAKLLPINRRPCFVVHKFYRGLAVVEKRSGAPRRFGIINTSGRLIADTDYDYISEPEQSGMYAARRGDTLFILDREGKNILSGAWLTGMLPQFEGGLLPVMVRLNDSKTENKLGFVDTRGRLVLDTIFTAGLNGNGRQLNRGNYFDGDRCMVNYRGKNVVINSRGEILFAIPHDFSGSVGNVGGCFIVHYNEPSHLGSQCNLRYPEINRYTLIGRDGTIIHCDEEIVNANNGFFILQPTSERQQAYYAEGGFGSLGTEFLDSCGRRRFARSYLSAKPFWNGYAQVILNTIVNERHPEGVIDTLGNFTPMAEFKLRAGENDWVLARLPGTAWPAHTNGVKNRKGKWVIAPKYLGLTKFENGFARYETSTPSGDRFGYLNTQGKEVIAPRFFEDAQPFVAVEMD